MIDPYDYYSWFYSEIDLKKLSIDDLRILANFEEGSYLPTPAARDSFIKNFNQVNRVLDSKLKVLARKRSSTPEVELKNLMKKIEIEEKELSLLRTKKQKIEQIEQDLERKIQRQIERIEYLKTL